MATFIAIPEKTQTATAMRRVLDYVMQDKKTVLDGIKLVSGQNCVPESAFEEFMVTKHRYGKASGVFFKQYVQSFKPDCGATPEQIRQIGVETAKAFPGFEVVVATHIDRDHWHNHFVVNSVNAETGLKIQINEKGLEQLRRRSDEICQQFGLEILKPYQKPQQQSMNQREYRAALRGDSKKLKLTNAIDYAVAHSRTKAQFINQMQRCGYGVKWIDHYQYITYTTPDGQRFRDHRLLDDKYRKRNMEDLFAYGFEKTENHQPDRKDHRADGRDLDRADPAAVSVADLRAVQQDRAILLDSWEQRCKDHGFDIRAADASRSERSGGSDAAPRSLGNAGDGSQSNGLDEVFRRGQVAAADGYLEESTPYGVRADAGGDESPRLDPVEAEAEMGSSWSNLALGGLFLAADLAMIGGGEKHDENHKKNYVRERKRGQRKNQREDHADGGMELNR